MNYIKADIINTNYIYEHKLYKYWRYLLILYAGLLIMLTSKTNFETILSYKEYIFIISEVFIFSSILVVLLNAMVFIRIGIFNIDEEEIHIKNGDEIKVYDISKVKSFAIEKASKNFYEIKIDGYKITIELKKEEAKKITTILSNADVSITAISLLGRLRKKLPF